MVNCVLFDIYKTQVYVSMGGGSALPRVLYTTPHPLILLFHPTPASQPAQKQRLYRFI